MQLLLGKMEEEATYSHWRDDSVDSIVTDPAIWD